MKHFILALFCLPFLGFAQVSFTAQGKGKLPKDYLINCIFPLNDNEVWALASQVNGNGSIKVCKTLDGGLTWTVREIDSAMRGYADDIFVQANGIAYANLEDFNVGSQWYKTIDGGLTWYKLETYLGTILHLYNMNEGAMISVQSAVWSNDSFHTHSTVRSNDPGGPPLGIGQSLLSGPNSRCVTDSGVFFIYPKGLVVRTQDKGKTWKGMDVGLNINKSTCGLAASGNSILSIQWPLGSVVKKGLSRSNDGGNTWINISSSIPSEIVRPSVVASVPNDNAHFLMTGYSEIYHSTDTGNNWSKIAIPADIQNRMSGVLMMSSSNIAWVGMTTLTDTQSMIYRCNLNFKPSSIASQITNKFSHIYPNPSNEILFIQTEINTQYSIFNAEGRLVAQGYYGGPESGIDLQKFAKGIYFLQSKSSDLLFTEKFIVE